MKKETSTAREISPDALMSDFRGRPVMSILTFTVIAHLLFIGFFSLGYLRIQVFGESYSSLSEEERLDQAMEEATRSLRKISANNSPTGLPEVPKVRLLERNLPSVPKTQRNRFPSLGRLPWIRAIQQLKKN